MRTADLALDILTDLVLEAVDAEMAGTLTELNTHHDARGRFTRAKAGTLYAQGAMAAGRLAGITSVAKGYPRAQVRADIKAALARQQKDYEWLAKRRHGLVGANPRRTQQHQLQGDAQFIRTHRDLYRKLGDAEREEVGAQADYTAERERAYREARESGRIPQLSDRPAPSTGIGSRIHAEIVRRELGRDRAYMAASDRLGRAMLAKGDAKKVIAGARPGGLQPWNSLPSYGSSARPPRRPRRRR